jgi:hypothetical protein
MALLGDRHRAGRQPYNPILATTYPKHIVKLGQLRAPHGRCAQSRAPSCATRTAVNDNQNMALKYRLKLVRILRLCASSNTVCTDARTKRPGIRTRGPRAYRPLARKLQLLLNVRLIRTMSAAGRGLRSFPRVGRLPCLR